MKVFAVFYEEIPQVLSFVGCFRAQNSKEAALKAYLHLFTSEEVDDALVEVTEEIQERIWWASIRKFSINDETFYSVVVSPRDKDSTK